MSELQIDSEFQALIPPLSDEERGTLESNLKAEGCRDPIVTWQGVILDGHNRYEICTRLGIPFQTVEVDLPDRESALDWIDANQLGRRNLSPDSFRYLLGRRYNRMKKASGGRTDRDFSGDQSDTPKTAQSLGDQYGVGEATVKRAGKFAEDVDSTPELKEAVEKGEPVAKAKQEIAREKSRRRNEELGSKEVSSASGEYDVIVMDPPWPMQKITRDVRPNQADFDYPTMNEDEIKAMDIPAAPDCHVFIWTTHKFLPMALRCAEHWGLRYICTFVWHKPGGFQPIGLPQYNAEFALYCRKGTPEFVDTKAFKTCFEADRGAHSEKPEEFYDVLRRVTSGRRLDMFNRRQIEGFEGWGNESANVA